jgi:hypothetical protein
MATSILKVKAPELLAKPALAVIPAIVVEQKAAK